MVGLMALALLLAATRGWLPAAVVTGAAMAVKLPALFVLVGVVLLSLADGSLVGRIRHTLAVGAVATATMVALGFSGGIGIGFVGALRVHWTHPSWLSATRYVGMVAQWLTGVPAMPVVAVGGVLLLGVMSVLAVLRTPLRDPVTSGTAAAVVLGLATAGGARRPLLVLPVVPAGPGLHAPGPGVHASSGRLILVLGVVAPVDPSRPPVPFAPYFVRGAIAAALVVAVLPPDRARQAGPAPLAEARTVRRVGCGRSRTGRGSDRGRCGGTEWTRAVLRPRPGRTTVRGMASMQERLRDAVNAHDAPRLAALFAEDYRSASPAHPGRAFVGRAQVLANWSSVFEGVPDFTAELMASAVDGDTEWGEWDWRGRHTDGSPFAMRGVIIVVVRDDLVAEAHLYMEPVDVDGGDIDVAVQELYKPPADT